MRFVLPLVALCALSSAPLRAGMFNITITGNPGSPSGSGTFTTDGICTICGISGFLSLTINIGPDSGPNAFDITDDPASTASVEYVLTTNAFRYDATNSETLDLLQMSNTNWSLFEGGASIGSGTYSITPAPEPRSLFLLLPIAVLVGLRWRRVMRFVLPLVALCMLSSAPLRAVSVTEFTLVGGPGSPSGSGTFITDGICVDCGLGSGLLSVTVNIGPDSGQDAFDTTDDSIGWALLSLHAHGFFL